MEIWGPLLNGGKLVIAPPGISSLAEYIGHLQASSDELKTLHEEVLINVTRFFRDPEVWHAFQTVLLPNLFGEAGAEIEMPRAMGTMLKAICIRREFNVWATDKSSPMNPTQGPNR